MKDSLQTFLLDIFHNEHFSRYIVTQRLADNDAVLTDHHHKSARGKGYSVRLGSDQRQSNTLKGVDSK